MPHCFTPVLVMLGGSRSGSHFRLFVLDQIAITCVRDQAMAGQPTPGDQINGDAGIGGPNLQRLIGSQATHAVGDVIQGAAGAASIPGIIEGISVQERGGAVIHRILRSFLDYRGPVCIFPSIRPMRATVSLLSKGNEGWRAEAKNGNTSPDTVEWSG